MESYRGLADLPDRMGFTAAEGGRVDSLPFAEGQILATIVDTWARVRVPPNVLTWGLHAQNAPGALQQMYTIRPRRYPISITSLWFETDPPGQTTSVRIVRHHGQGIPTGSPVIVTKMLEGSNDLQVGSDNVVVTQEADAQVQDHGGQVVFANASAPIILPGIPGIFPLPVYVLPGQSLVFQASIAAQIVGINIIWQQFSTNVDVLTSGTRPPPPP